MSLYLDTRGNTQVGIAICGRCKFKFPITKLMSDPNTGEGLRVCVKCKDEFDPWRLPARQTEDITLRYPRPDTPLNSTNEMTGSTVEDV